MKIVKEKAITTGPTKEYWNKDNEMVAVEGKGWSTFRIFDERKNLVLEVFVGKKATVLYRYTYDELRWLSVFSDSFTYYPTYKI